jgi:hypothetical protein
MLCPECGWWDDWEDSASPYCEFCGSLLSATSDDPPDAHETIAQAEDE